MIPLKTLGLGMAAGLMAGCSLLSPLPDPAGLTERLAAFPTAGLPLRGAVTVHWNERHIPFIEAEHDGDAAFALGLVHAHLRLGQMAMARMVARGRLSEMAGPVAIDIDKGLRILSFSRAADEIERAMDRATRDWVSRFVEGINHYQNAAAELPHEFRVLNLEREPWTVADVVTIGRLAGIDVNWLVWLDLLPLRKRPGWPELWTRLLEKGRTSPPSFDGVAKLASLSRSGSNSLALAPRRTSTGGAILANDPHLGIFVPNVWLIAGIKSPSFHAVGLMGPGLPIFAIGRNPHVAWGGTNMRAASSDLYDVSALPAADIAERKERIAVRWWFDGETTVRDTPYGPILSDAPLLAESGLPPVALKWTGHQASDEIGAMLAASRARNFRDFRKAFDRFAVPGQNMLYADAEGNIGQVMAVRLPARRGPPADLVVDTGEHDAVWTNLLPASRLPFSFNPETGYLASANNRPAATDMPVGFFFSGEDRVRRMAEVIEAATPVGIDTLSALHRDVRAASAAALRDSFISKLDAADIAADDRGAEALRRMRDWDGHYRPDSLGAVSFEQFRKGFVSRFYALKFGDASAYAESGRIAALLREDVEAADDATVRDALAAGIEAAAIGLGKFDDWADMHRLRLAHPLAFLPIVGDRYAFAEYGVGGSNETLMKTAHEATVERHRVNYGSNARHISDMADPDANYFVLLGGQDGWLGSSTLLDQWPLWRDGEYIRMPLSLDAVRRSFPYRMTLRN